HADMGKTLVYSLIVGIPTAMVAGPLFARFIAPRVPVQLSGSLVTQLTSESATTPPRFAVAVFTILSPVLLMLLAAAARLTLASGSVVLTVAEFLGHPAIALLIAVLIASYTFGFARG